MEQLIQKRPFIISNAECKYLERVSLSQNEFQEEWLQKLLQNHPEMLPVAEIDPVFSPLVCIGREVRTPAGPIDNLYISPTGNITILETKLWRNPEARRAVVGQILDYTKELKHFSYEDLDRSVKQYHKTYYNKSTRLFELMVDKGLLSPDNESLFIDLVEKNLRNARFLLLIVGDGIREGVWRMAKFLNETPNMQYTLALVQLEVYQLSDTERIVVPNLLAQTEVVERGVFRFEKGEILPVETQDVLFEKAPDSKKPSIDDFYNAFYISHPLSDKNSLADFITDLEDLGYLVSTSGKKDLVIRYPMPGSKQPINVLHLSPDPKIGAFKFRGTLERDLENRGYSKEIAKEFFNDINPYLISSEDAHSMNHDIDKMLSEIDTVRPIFEKLTRYF